VLHDQDKEENAAKLVINGVVFSCTNVSVTVPSMGKAPYSGPLGFASDPEARREVEAMHSAVEKA
jgi:hypothetical protein